MANSISMMVQDLLVLFLVVGMPLWDWYEIPRLKAGTGERKKVRYYRKIVIVLWICALAAVATIGLVSAFTIRPAPGETSWLAAGSRSARFLEGITIGALLAIFVPAVIALWNQKLRSKAAKAAKRLAFLLPSSGEERRWWWLVCSTAGICEEIVYRGFLLHYFQHGPVHLNLTWALAVSSLIFGIGHLYQGIVGSVQTAVVGFLLGGIFIASGSLLLPMVIHALLDLRVLAMLPQGFETAAA
jgi:membrane protease YdiL (CAAX protease family)